MHRLQKSITHQQFYSVVNELRIFIGAYKVPHIHIMHSGGNSQGVESGYNQENIIAIILFLEQLINKR